MVQIFDGDGELLMFFGEPREGAFSLILPAHVHVSKTLIPYFMPFAAPSFDLEYVVLVTSQYGEHKVSVFGIGR